MYFGRFQQGGELYLTVRTTTRGTLNPDTPLSAPFLQIYREASPPVKVLDSSYLAAYQPGLMTGVFRLSVFFGALFTTADRYFAIVRWTDSGGNGVQAVYPFELMPGGNSDGAVIAMAEVVRPDARYLLCSTDGGLLVRRKNPR
jgi:hypothetical protein